MPNQDDINGQLRLLKQYHARLAHLLRQRALFGVAYVPSYIATEIDDARSNIRRIKNILYRWNILVEDKPDDDDQDLPDLGNLSSPPTSTPTDRTLDDLEQLSSYEEDLPIPPSPPPTLETPPNQRDYIRAPAWYLLRGWICATMLSWLSLGVLGWLPSRVLQRWLGSATPNIFPRWLLVLITFVAVIVVWSTVTLGFTGGAIGGATIGATQWLGLRHIDTKFPLWRWLLANAFAGGLAKSIFYLTTRDIIFDFDLATAMLSLSVIPSALVFGVLTGVTLVWMLHITPTSGNTAITAPDTRGTGA